ncbi:MAG: Crp/Fnr family transcriptional regulator [Pseudomonadota bacterium]
MKRSLQKWQLGTSLDDIDPGVIAPVLPFDDLAPTDLKEMLSKATIEHVTSNESVFDEGDNADHFYVLLDGVMRILRTTEDGEQVVVLHVMPGDMFGIAQAMGHDTYRMTARAAASGLAMCWPSEVWEQFIRSYPGFRAATTQALGARADEMQEKIVEMATLKVEQRIAHAILRLIKKAGKETKHGLEIDFPLTRQDLSEMTGTTLHSVSRYLSQWQKSGIVESKRRRVIVRRPADLPV